MQCHVVDESEEASGLAVECFLDLEPVSILQRDYLEPGDTLRIPNRSFTWLWVDDDVRNSVHRLIFYRRYAAHLNRGSEEIQNHTEPTIDRRRYLHRILPVDVYIHRI